MTESVLGGASPYTSDNSAPSRSRLQEYPNCDRCDSLYALNESVFASDRALGNELKRRQRRRFITLAIVAGLLVGFVLIATWGLAHSDWLYGTYGGVRQTDWDEMTRLRAELARLGAAPGAIAALDDALLVPRPSTENIIYDLQKAVLILETDDTSVAARELTVELRGLISRLQPTYAQPSANTSRSLFPQE